MFSKKGLVVEKEPGWAIIMLPDGEFKKIKTNQYMEVGEFFAYTNMSPIKYMAAAVLLLALLLSSVDYFSVKAYARVSSLAELGVNRWGRVISVKATDQNGEKVLQKVKVKNDKLEVAIEKIYNQALKDKQINNVSNQLILSIDIPADPKLENKMIKKMTDKLPNTIHSEKKQEVGNSLTNKKKSNENHEKIQNEEPLPEENSLLNPINKDLNEQIPVLHLNHEQKIEIKDLKDHLDKTKSTMNKSSNETDQKTETVIDSTLLDSIDIEIEKNKNKDNSNSSNKNNND